MTGFLKFLRTWRYHCTKTYDIGLASHPSLPFPRALCAIEDGDRGIAPLGPCRAHAHQHTFTYSLSGSVMGANPKQIVSSGVRYGNNQPDVLWTTPDLSSVFVLTFENEAPF